MEILKNPTLLEEFWAVSGGYTSLSSCPRLTRVCGWVGCHQMKVCLNLESGEKDEAWPGVPPFLLLPGAELTGIQFLS